MNCAAIPETLLESEIFGHEKGAFTGAHDGARACFELAHRGTLFLDEIAEMQPATQVKLLRVLQERTSGGSAGARNRRSTCASSRRPTSIPTEAVTKGKLREDLYYRLNVFAIELPPLRDATRGYPAARAGVPQRVQRAQRQVGAGVDQEAMRLLEHYPWPGNIRELRNVIERATILAEAIHRAGAPAADADARAKETLRR